MSNSSKGRLFRRVIIGVSTGLVLSTAITALIAYMVHMERIEWHTADVLRHPVLVISVAVSGIVAAGRAGEKVALYAGFASALYILVLLAIGILFFGGLGSGAFYGLLCILAGYVFACAICIMKGGKRRNRKRLAV